MRFETIEKNAAGERLERAGDEFEKSGFAAGVGAENGDEFAGLGLKAHRFQSEERRLGGIRRVGIADLLDAQTDVGGGARGVSGKRVTKRAAHAILRRSR